MFRSYPKFKPSAVRVALPLVRAAAPPREMPSLARRARNFTRAAVAQVGGLARSGQWSATEEEITARQAICQACEWLRKSDATCLHPRCGCPTKRKARWQHATCPEGKWVLRRKQTSGAPFPSESLRGG